MRSLAYFAAGLSSVALLLQPSLALSRARNPVDYVTLIDEATIHTTSHRVNAFSKFDLSFLLHDGKQKVRMSLEPNLDVMHETMTVTTLDSYGNVKSVEPIDRADHKVFKGKAFIQRLGEKEWTHVGWARITLHRDGKTPIFEGAFRVDGNNHHIHTGTNYQSIKHAQDPAVDAASGKDKMVVWRDSDILEDHEDHDGTGELKKRGAYGRGSCGSEQLEYNSNFNPGGLELRDMSPLASAPEGLLFARQNDDAPGRTGNNAGAGINLVANIGSTSGCPTTRKVALLGVAADCNYRAAFDSQEETRRNIINQVHLASEVYESTFDISLGIQNLTIIEDGCPSTPSPATPWNVDCDSGTDISDRLSLFSEWRGRTTDTNAYWMLLSTCATGSAVGLAWLGQICQQGSQTNPTQDGGNETISSTNVVIRTGSEWQVIAHETGHTFGAVHDCTGQTCDAGDNEMQKCCPLSAGACDARSDFIMNPSTGRGIQNFSPCSIGNICGSVGLVGAQCLVANQNVQVITEAQCGNGIVEGDEECDCGGEESCAENSCCDASTCKFTDGSVCDPSNAECCTDACQFSSRGTVCRESSGFCDPEETCPGDNALCPEDKHRDDGSGCGEDGKGLKCASGQCTSRDTQCRAMLGNTLGTSTNDESVKACEDTGCQLLCESDSVGSNTCVQLNQNFLDGTPCQGGGTCSNGRCDGASIGNEILDWIRGNKNIVIPVASVLGGIILIAILSCIFGSIRRRMRFGGRKKKQQQQLGANGAPKQPTSQLNSWASYGGSFTGAGGVVPRNNNPSRQNIPRGPGGGGAGGGPSPTASGAAGPGGGPMGSQGLPPTYSPFQPYQPQWGSRGQSMRYA